MFLFVLFALASVASAVYQEPECAGYNHPTYGCAGECTENSNCDGSNSVSGKCPSQSVTIKCCFTPDTDSQCYDYVHSTYGQSGRCIPSGECPGSTYLSGYCPTKAADIKCCFSKASCTQTGGDNNYSAKNAACEILSRSSITAISNNNVFNSLGANDGASALENLQDTCNGNSAKRSSYCCSSGCTPGGFISMKSSVLNYILNAHDASGGASMQINCLAGACHSTNSWHYQGTAVDFQVSGGSPYSTWQSVCGSSGARENLGPGDSGHSTHTHCAFSS